MKKIDNKLDNFFKATKRFNEAVTAYKNNKNDLIRDALIQRFEFTFELAWKTLREFMIDQGYLNDGLNSPKFVLKTAYSESIISNEEDWLNALECRNQMAHTYDEQAAIQLAEKIIYSFNKIFDQLCAFLKKSQS